MRTEARLTQVVNGEIDGREHLFFVDRELS